jgi:hypothetical protein
MCVYIYIDVIIIITLGTHTHTHIYIYITNSRLQVKSRGSTVESYSYTSNSAIPVDNYRNTTTSSNNGTSEGIKSINTRSTIVGLMPETHTRPEFGAQDPYKFRSSVHATTSSLGAIQSVSGSSSTNVTSGAGSQVSSTSGSDARRREFIGVGQPLFSRESSLFSRESSHSTNGGRDHHDASSLVGPRLAVGVSSFDNEVEINRLTREIEKNRYEREVELNRLADAERSRLLEMREVELRRASIRELEAKQRENERLIAMEKERLERAKRPPQHPVHGDSASKQPAYMSSHSALDAPMSRQATYPSSSPYAARDSTLASPSSSSLYPSGVSYPATFSSFPGTSSSSPYVRDPVMSHDRESSNSYIRDPVMTYGRETGLSHIREPGVSLSSSYPARPRTILADLDVQEGRQVFNERLVGSSTSTSLPTPLNFDGNNSAMGDYNAMKNSSGSLGSLGAHALYAPSPGSKKSEHASPLIFRPRAQQQFSGNRLGNIPAVLDERDLLPGREISENGANGWNVLSTFESAPRQLQQPAQQQLQSLLDFDSQYSSSKNTSSSSMNRSSMPIVHQSMPASYSAASAHTNHAHTHDFSSRFSQAQHNYVPAQKYGEPHRYANHQDESGSRGLPPGAGSALASAPWGSNSNNASYSSAGISQSRVNGAGALFDGVLLDREFGC